VVGAIELGLAHAIVTPALPVFAGSATLAAITVTSAGDGITAGAVYTAELAPFTTIVPTVAFPPGAPFTLQMTPPATPPVPEMLAVKTCAPPGATVAVAGETEIAMPSCKVTLADAWSFGFS
jgi:hypothetical protein